MPGSIVDSANKKAGQSAGFLVHACRLFQALQSCAPVPGLVSLICSPPPVSE